MKRNSILQVLSLFWAVVALPLAAQGYETKFKAVGFKPGDVYHSDEGVNVSLNGGGLEVNLPLGPAIPGPIPMRPMAFFHEKYVQPVNPHWYYGIWNDEYVWPPCLTDPNCVPPPHTQEEEWAWDRNWRRWGLPSMPSAGMHPGKLLLYVGGDGKTADNSKDSYLKVDSPFGKTAEFFQGGPGTHWYQGDPGRVGYSVSDVTEVRALLSAVAPDWAYASSWGSASTGTVGMRTSTGSILVFGPHDHGITYKWDFYTNSDRSTKNLFTTLPTEVLEVDGDLITLWRFSRNTYKPDFGGGITTWDGTVHVADQFWWLGSIYHPVWIKNRSGFKINVQVFRNNPGSAGSGGAGYSHPELSETGLITGYKVWADVGGQGYQVSLSGDPLEALNPRPGTITYTGMWGSTTTGLVLSGETNENPDTLHYVTQNGEQSNGWNVGTLYRKYHGLDCASDELRLDASQIISGPITYSLQYNGPHGLMSKLTTSTGKTYDFTYAITQGVGVQPPLDGLVSQIAGWTYNTSAPAIDYWSVVTKMAISGGGETRATTYQWAIPKPDMVLQMQGGNWAWASKHQGVAQTLPDGQTILHVFAPVVDLQTYYSIPAPTLDLWARTFLAQRQTPVARYYYAAGDGSWNSFISGGADPAASNWYRRELLEGFDLRSWESTLTKILSNTEPRPTRTIHEERGGPVEVTESDGWDPSRNTYAVSRSYSLPAGTSTSGQFWAPGLFGGGSSYPSASGATALTESTTTFASIEAGLFVRPQQQVTRLVTAPPSASAGTVSDIKNQFNSGSLAHLLLSNSQNATDGTALSLMAAFSYGTWGGYTRMKSASLSSPALSGTAGYTYDYEGTGRWLTSIQSQGVLWKEQEPAHDWAGRPLSQVDANGIQTSYTWDDLGRVTGIIPQPPELPTTVMYDGDFLGAVATRGTASTHYRYDAFGDLISVQKPTGETKTFSYDLGGRKLFESVWAGTAGTNTSYDTQGRTKRIVNANGEVSDLSYATPLLRSITRYPEIAGSPSSATTTFEKDVLGRLAKVTDAKGQVTNYTYDPTGRLRFVQQSSQTRSWTYNGLGWLTGLQQPESGSTTYSDFSIFGKARSTSYAGRVVSTTYDAIGRATDVNAVDGSVRQHFEFDGGVPFNGKLRYSTDSGVRVDYGYQGLNGRLSSLNTTVDPVQGALIPPFAQGFGYDNYGHLSSATLPSGRSVSYGYDLQRGALKQAQAQSGVPGALGAMTPLASVTLYNPADSPLQVAFSNGASTSFSYSADQARLASMTHAKTGANAFSRAWIYGWDAAGQLKSDGEDSYQYDALSRLIQANLKPLGGTSTINQAFTYDTFGNQVSSRALNLPLGIDRNFANFAFNAADLAPTNRLPALTATGGLTGASYDPQGNLVQIFKQVGDLNRSVSLTYDALGRASQMVDAELGLTEKYFYTPEGLRTRIETYQGSTLLKVEFRIYNHQRQLVSKYATTTAAGLRAKTQAPQGTSKTVAASGRK